MLVDLITERIEEAGAHARTVVNYLAHAGDSWALGEDREAGSDIREARAALEALRSHIEGLDALIGRES